MGISLGKREFSHTAKKLLLNWCAFPRPRGLHKNPSRFVIARRIESLECVTSVNGNIMRNEPRLPGLSRTIKMSGLVIFQVMRKSDHVSKWHGHPTPKDTMQQQGTKVMGERMAHRSLAWDHWLESGSEEVSCKITIFWCFWFFSPLIYTAVEFTVLCAGLSVSHACVPFSPILRVVHTDFTVHLQHPCAGTRDLGPPKPPSLALLIDPIYPLWRVH